MKPEIFWAIMNTAFGLYAGTFFTRRGAIETHCVALGKDWKSCRRAGDRAVRVEIKVIKTGGCD